MQIVKRYFCSLMAFGLIAGCSAKTESRKPTSALDTPKHHLLRANDFIAQENWSQARREVRLAQEISPQNPVVLSMQALITAHESTLAGKSATEKQKLYLQSQKLLENALNSDSTAEDKLQVFINSIRTQVFLKDNPNWYENAKNSFADAQEVIESNPQLYPLIASLEYHMGTVHESAFEFEQASKSYRTVAQQRGAFLQQATKALERIEQILRAAPTTDRGNHIATLKALTRADMAALLVEEFQLAKLTQSQAKENSNQYQVPESQKTFQTTQNSQNLATDISDHPLQADIEEAIKHGIRGMQPDPRKLFYPNEVVTRAEYAMILEDILMSLTGEPDLATRFIGESSPWQDVRPDAFYYNAARVLVSRGIMSLNDKLSAQFEPQKPISGSQALLGLRLLSNEIRSTR